MEAYQSEFAKQETEHDALLKTLTIPADDGRGTYSDRRLQAQWVQEKDETWITGTSGWTAGCPQEVAELLSVGDPYIMETKGFNYISGWIIDGKWYGRKTDEDIQAEHEAFVAEIHRKREEELERNREDWQRRQDALPDWVRTRLEEFHVRSGGKFAADGWGYELVIAELAVEYAALGDVILGKDVFEIHDHESEAIKRIADEQGTSGNQHGFALALAKAHLADPYEDMAGTVSALSPITGDPFYEGD